MRKFILILISGIILSPWILFAQQMEANISFDEMEFDFGQIDEKNGVVNHKFEFTNTGNKSLVIHDANSTCGCTVPSWTKVPVKSGERGFVNAEYSPVDRPGKFEKYITVHSNATTPTVQLKIIGNVIAKPLRIEDQYPVVFGGLRLKSKQVLFGTIYKGQQLTNYIELINASDIAQTISTKALPPHIKINIPMPTLAPRQTGIIEITFNSALKDNGGFVTEWLNIYVNNYTDTNYRINIIANIKDDKSVNSK